MAEVFGSTATSAGKHNGEGMLRKLIKTVRQWKDNGAEEGLARGWEKSPGSSWRPLGNRKHPNYAGDVPGIRANMFALRGRKERVCEG